MGDVIAFAPLVASALERVIMRRKMAARQSVASELATDTTVTPFVPPIRPRRAPTPSLDERAAALASALDLPTPTPGQLGLLPESPARAPAGSPETSHTPPPGSVRPSRTVTVGDSSTGPVRKRTEPGLARPVIPVGSGGRTSTPPQGTPTVIESDREPTAAVFPLTRRTPPPGHRPEAEEPPEDGWEASSASAPSAFPAEEAGTKPGVGSFPPPRRSPTSPGLGIESAPPPTHREGSNPKLELVPETVLDEEVDSGPNISVGEEELDEDIAELEAKRAREVPLAAASRSVSFGARRPRPRRSSEELKLPSVIVDLESDCQELVSRLVKGDADAGNSLVDIGQPAVTALLAAFPGPITSDPRRGEAPARASDCGPVLRTLARIGHASVPFLVVRTADASPDVRSWATRPLGELPGIESAPRGRAAAGGSGPRRASRGPGGGTAPCRRRREPAPRCATGCAKLAADPQQSDDVRHAAIEALADLREARAVPRLLPLLSDANADVVKSVHWALEVIARQDFGSDPERWREWWQKHSDQHRIQWLIDALMHENPDIRRAAGEELKSLTKEYFGYYDDLPKKERARAQRRYQEWVERRGKARFIEG